MARRPRSFQAGAVYHVVARGNHRQPTFLAARDYAAYLRRLRRYAGEYDVGVYAYCLMPNHVHLLVRQAGVPLSRFMQGLQQSYTRYFNLAYQTVGHLFQGRYRAVHCEDDRQLATVIRYIHLNPAVAGLVSRPDEYAYSSHRAYLTGTPTLLLDPRPVLTILGGPAAYRALFADAAAERPGDVAERLPRRDAAPPAPPPVGDRMDLEPAVETLAAALGVTRGMLAAADRSRPVGRARLLAAFTLVRQLGYPARAVAAALGRPVSSLSVLLSRAAARHEDAVRVHAESSLLAGLLGRRHPPAPAAPNVKNDKA